MDENYFPCENIKLHLLSFTTTGRQPPLDHCWSLSSAKGIFENVQNIPENLIRLPNTLKYTCLEKLFQR